MFLVLLLLECVSATAQTRLCSAINSTKYEAIWPVTISGSATASQPPCIGKSKEFLFRECKDGTWGPEPECDYVQPTTLPQCPEGFTETDNICYQLSPKSAFPPVCPFEDVLPFHSYVHEVDHHEPIWMPVQRLGALGFLQWIEPSSLYKSDFEDEYHFKGHIKGKDCLLYYNSSYIEAVSCMEEHIGVCAYSKFVGLTSTMCPSSSCHRSDFAITSKCFCWDPKYESSHKAEFVKPYQNFFITNSRCAIGLEKSDSGTYVWSNSNTEPDYTYWATTEKFDKNYAYTVTADNGWVQTDTIDCSLREVESQILEPLLVLAFDERSSWAALLTLNSRGIKRGLDSEDLIVCFADIIGPKPVYRLKKYLDWFHAVVDHPVDYWCESFKYPDLKNIKSNVVLFKRPEANLNYEFVAILRTHYIREINPLSKDILSFLDQELTAVQVEGYASRIMKIEDLEEESLTIAVNVHYSPKTIITTSEEEEYDRIKSLLEGFGPEVVDFRTCGYCAPEKTGNMSWPKTSVNQQAAVYCLTSKRTKLQRWCKRESFADGAKWEEAENCNPAEESEISQELVKIINDENACDTIDGILQNYKKFQYLDIYLLGEVVEKCFAETTIDQEQMNRFVDIYNVISNIDKTILGESEKKMRATTMLLKLFGSSGDHSTIATVAKDNLLQVRLSSQDSNGIMLVKNSNSFEPRQLLKDSVEEITATEGLEYAIWLTPQFRARLAETDVVSFTFFFNDALFVEQTDVPKNPNQICSGFFVKSEEKITEAVWHFQRVEHQTQENCISWEYAEETGYWKVNAEMEAHSSFVICKFVLTSGYYATTRTTSRLTNALNDLLLCNCTVEETIQHLLTISWQYLEFTPIDVHLTGKILQKVSGDNGVAVDSLAEIVSNLVKIRREVLEESQQWKGATDMILHYIDVILQNHEYEQPVQVVQENFVAVITKLKDSNFSGLVVLGQKQVKILENNDFFRYNDFETAFELGQDLKSQIDNNSTIIATLFMNDALFNKNSLELRSVSKIFGIILPNNSYSSPITIFHKVRSRKPKRCVHWAYNQPQNIPGFWNKDNEGNTTDNLVVCQYWHTTHFALLIDKFLENEVLDWITMVNCSLSLFGLVDIIFTAVVFKKWRTKIGNQILLNFSAVIILQIVVFFVSSGLFKASIQVCTVVGAVLHYSIVSEFCWMLVIAFLQYKRFVQVFGGAPEGILWKASLCGWVLPLVPVIFVLIFGSYVDGNVRLCYPSGLGLYLGVWLPLVAVLAVNVVLFGNIMYHVVSNKTERHCSARERVLKWRLGILLFFLLGLTWVFGFLAELDVDFFVYLFCATATLQGFVVFLFFIVLNLETRSMYWKGFKKWQFSPYQTSPATSVAFPERYRSTSSI